MLYCRRKNSAGVEVEHDHEQIAEEPVSKKAKRNRSNFLEAAVSSADEIGNQPDQWLESRRKWEHQAVGDR